MKNQCRNEVFGAGSDKSVIKKLERFINENYEEVDITVSEDGRYILGFFRTAGIFPDELEEFIISMGVAIEVRTLSVNYMKDYISFRKYSGGKRIF